MNSLKSQIKMFETIAILVIFFILVSIGFVYYNSISQSLIKQESRERIELESIQAAQRLTYLPELKCTSSIAKEIGSCVDFYKILAFRDMFHSDNSPEEYYYDILGYSTITVYVIYPEEEGIVIYDKPKPNFKTKTAYQIPVVLLKEGVKNSRCGPEFSNAQCLYGLIEIGAYS